MLVAVFVGVLTVGAPTAQAYPCGSATCPWTGWMPLTFTYNGSPLAIAALVPGGVGGRIDAIVYSNPGCPMPLPCSGKPEFVGISSQVEPNGQVWSPVSPLPTGSGAATDAVDVSVTAFRDGAGFLHVFKGYTYDILGQGAPTSVVGTGGSPSGWDAWHPGPGFFPTAGGLNQDGRLEVFAIRWHRNGLDPLEHGPIMHSWQLPQGGWSAGFQLTSEEYQRPIAVGNNADGRLQVFATRSQTDPTGTRHGPVALGSAWQTTPNGTWSAERDLAGADVIVGSLANDADGRMELFGRGPSGPVNMWQYAPNSIWSGAVPFSASAAIGPGSTPAAARGQTGRLEAFVADQQGTVLGSWQYFPGRSFANWSPLPGARSDRPEVTTNADGHLVLFDRTAGVWNIQET